MTTRAKVLCACLLSLGLPPPLGLMVPLAARLAGLSAPVSRALASFGAAAFVSELSARRAPAPAGRQQARHLRGFLRQPAPDRHAVQTDAGTLEVRLADDLAVPPPGTPIEALARLDPWGRWTLVQLQARGPPEGAWLERWRQLALARIDRLVRRPANGLVAALVVGDRSDLPGPLWRQARRSGSVHLLALSGLHVGLAALLFGRLLGWCGLPGELPRSVALLAFVGLAGAGPALLRALVGWCLVVWGRRGGRADSGLEHLAAVAVLLLCWQPSLVHHLGAQLSFAAVAGLMAMPGPGWLAPIGAVLITAPVCAACFGEVAWVGVLVTPLLLPIVAAILGLGVLACLTGELFSAADPLWSWALQLGADRFLWLEELLEQLVPEPLRPRALPLPAPLVSILLLAALVRTRAALHGATARAPRTSGAR